MSTTTGHRSSWMPWRSLVVLLFFALVGGLLLSAEHRAHAIGVLPWLLILLLCPLMHVFMHGGHGGHGGHGDDGEDDAALPGRPASDSASLHRH